MRFRYAVAGTALALCAAVGVPAAASAATAGTAAGAASASSASPSATGIRAAIIASRHSSIPWQQFRTQPFTDAPGVECSFGLAGTIVKDEEQTRILEYYPNGNPKLQEFRGPLFIRYTNMDTGKSAVRNLSGYGWFLYQPDGGTKIFVPSHFGYSIPTGNTAFPNGEWVFNGQLTVEITASGQVSIHFIHATDENMCVTLS